MKQTYRLHEVSSYINWLYFFHAWGFPSSYASIADIHGCDSCRAMWLARFPEEERMKAAEAMQLFKEAQRMLNALDADFCTHAVFRLAEANSEENDLWLDGVRFPLLRQQTVKENGEPFLCLSDFVRPKASGIPDKVGLFATTVDAAMEQLYPDDAYKRMLVQTLADRLAEATAEKLQAEVLPKALRPAVGYPSLPDQSINFLLDELLDMKQVGIKLTENGMMRPHASVSGLMIAHPASHYFSVGRIGDDQLADYAARRGLPIEVMRKFLATNVI